MTQRKGATYRLLDGKRFTVAVGGSYICDGGHRRPTVRIIDRPHHYRSVELPLPHVRFRRCWRMRRVGGLVVYRLYTRAMRRLCKPGR